MPSPRPQLYIDSGDAGSSNDGRDQTIRVRDHLLQLGYHYNDDLTYYLDHGGQHSEIYWQRRFFRPIMALYPIPLLQPIRSS
jgi:hypothetical protein